MCLLLDLNVDVFYIFVSFTKSWKLEILVVILNAGTSVTDIFDSWRLSYQICCGSFNVCLKQQAGSLVVRLGGFGAVGGHLLNEYEDPSYYNSVNDK